MTIKRLLGFALIAGGSGLLLALWVGALPPEADIGVIMLAVVMIVTGLETGGFRFFTKRADRDRAPQSGEPPEDR